MEYKISLTLTHFIMSHIPNLIMLQLNICVVLSTIVTTTQSGAQANPSLPKPGVSHGMRQRRSKLPVLNKHHVSF